jgi:hypothetical protein
MSEWMNEWINKYTNERIPNQSLSLGRAWAIVRQSKLHWSRPPRNLFLVFFPSLSIKISRDPSSPWRVLASSSTSLTPLFHFLISSSPGHYSRNLSSSWGIQWMLPHNGHLLCSPVSASIHSAPLSCGNLDIMGLEITQARSGHVLAIMTRSGAWPKHGEWESTLGLCWN